MRILIWVVLLLLLAAPVLANPVPWPPTEGTYVMNDLWGPCFSESWDVCGGHGEIGNTFHSIVIGATIGSGFFYDPELEDGLWRIWCPSISEEPTLLSDTRDGTGTGDVTWFVSYAGGHFMLSLEGPWSEYHEVDYPGNLTRFEATTVYHYDCGELETIHASIYTTGRFEWYNFLCITQTIDIVVSGTTGEGPFPPEYPDLLDPACQAGTRTEGAFGSVLSSTLTIQDCTSSAAEWSWGRIKELYREQ